MQVITTSKFHYSTKSKFHHLINVDIIYKNTMKRCLHISFLYIKMKKSYITLPTGKIIDNIYNIKTILKQ